ncbi:hypothetical protein [Tabrizicola sp.]|uniref:hypothetical protein n=1 Tax=Tabrizicola sp. TaxID=2005166 RepID=UPI002736D266|nr:hypothetical protein [Tabrizicola sp.]MDP3195344.1 hypothetical protein [Tabrizicola sp.]
MLRILALICAFALLLAPLGPAQANTPCTMLAVSQDAVHAAHGPDHQMPVSGHASQACKQHCAIVGLLAPAEPVLMPFLIGAQSPRAVVRLLQSRLPDPSERPPKHLI